MQLIHKSYKTLMVITLSVFAMGLFFQSCEKEETFELKAFGPSEVVRGGEIFFVGTKLNEIVEITLPDGSTFGRNDFLSSSSEKITLRIPEDYPLGLNEKVSLKLSNGRIIEPQGRFQVFYKIEIESIVPTGEGNPLKPGEEITINGVNLNEVLAVFFKNGSFVEAADFTSQIDNAIKLVLPQTVSGGAVIVAIYSGEVDEYGEQIISFVEGPEITVIDPELSKINGESMLTVRPASKLTLSGEYFGGIDIVNGGVVVMFTESQEKATGEIDVVKNTLTFDLPIRLEAEKEIAVVIAVNGGKEITSTAKFTIEKTEVTGYTVESVWEPRGTMTLVGNNLNAVARVTSSYFVQEEGEDGEIIQIERERAIPISAKPEDGKTITFNLPAAYGRDGLEIPKLYLYSGSYIYYNPQE